MSEYYAVQRSDEYLAHYGIRGMKWGVKKAIDRGSDRALGRQYKKAQKKLAKLEKRANNGSKYAKRAAALGVGAAAAGGLALAGTSGVARGLSKASDFAVKGGTRAYMKAVGTKNNIIKQAGRKVFGAGFNSSIGLSKAAKKVGDWGAQTNISEAASKHLAGLAQKGYDQAYSKGASKLVKEASHRGATAAGQAGSALRGVTNNQIARVGAAALGAGLGIAAGRNAYKAATAKKYKQKAAQFRTEMNKAFAGTKYANGAPRHKKKK